MAFTIELYKNSDESIKVNKTNLELVEVVTGTLREATNLISPSFVLEYDLTSHPFNYAFIEAFNRYYYVSNITSLNTGLWRVDFREDVLMSYKDKIAQLEAVIDRNEYDYNPNLEDNMVRFVSNPEIEVIEMMDNHIFTEPEATYSQQDGLNIDSTGRLVLVTSTSIGAMTSVGVYPSQYYVVSPVLDAKIPQVEGTATFEVQCASGYVFTGVITNNLSANGKFTLQKTFSDSNRKVTLTISNTNCNRVTLTPITRVG